MMDISKRGSKPEVVAAAEYALTVGPERAGKEFGVKPPTIRRYLKVHGLEWERYKREDYDLELEILTALASVNPGWVPSQEELADLLGIERNTVSDIELRAKRKLRREHGDFIDEVFRCFE